MMEKHIIGAYDSTNEAAAVVDQLSRKGYSPEEILVVSNRDRLGSLENKTGLQVEQSESAQHDQSMWDKVKEAFTMDEETSSNNRLSQYDLSETDTRRYESDLNDGKILIAVEANSATGLDEFRTVPGNPGTESNQFTSSTTNTADQEESMELREERLSVDKEEVKTGEITIGKDVVEEERSVDVPVRHEEVYVEKRHLADGETRTAADLGDEEEIRIPVVEEKVEVKKKPVVTDEVVIGKRTTEETEHIHDTVKKEEVHLDKEGSSRIQGEERLNQKSNNEPLNRTSNDDPFVTGQEGITDTDGIGSEKERRDRKNIENLNDNRFRGNDYRGDM
ncbi:YsnF/AvaK domain-containing protein [Rossellomorea vietnamensis]|uniref:YsnF/AvaK domain-containing protein n=1 Tax=Rossellomorea vietnamensis TaxID=218284 RepID=A0A5D4NKU4_9BACI|nr:YsnF/AvaK domain-containing protein [Rossellomorea vietnamensis]TYS14510.1 YsnF/AvaK domain-containing protein [Rossellomorea vietnamensis]